jgi:hypothetical protein
VIVIGAAVIAAMRHHRAARPGAAGAVNVARTQTAPASLALRAKKPRRRAAVRMIRFIVVSFFGGRPIVEFPHPSFDG